MITEVRPFPFFTAGSSNAAHCNEIIWTFKADHDGFFDTYLEEGVLKNLPAPYRHAIIGHIYLIPTAEVDERQLTDFLKSVHDICIDPLDVYTMRMLFSVLANTKTKDTHTLDRKLLRVIHDDLETRKSWGSQGLECEADDENCGIKAHAALRNLVRTKGIRLRLVRAIAKPQVFDQARAFMEEMDRSWANTPTPEANALLEMWEYDSSDACESDLEEGKGEVAHKSERGGEENGVPSAKSSKLHSDT